MKTGEQLAGSLCAHRLNWIIFLSCSLTSFGRLTLPSLHLSLSCSVSSGSSPFFPSRFFFVPIIERFHANSSAGYAGYTPDIFLFLARPLICINYLFKRRHKIVEKRDGYLLYRMSRAIRTSYTSFTVDDRKKWQEKKLNDLIMPDFL